MVEKTGSVTGLEPGTHPPELDSTVPFQKSASAETATASEPRPNIGEYTIEGELGRGGMGVVYKARHRTLKRTVALKMILPKPYLLKQEVDRFLTEAEAVARLNHVGIVPLFEVGEHQGNRYLAMGFVEGESLLEKVREHPLSSCEAAEVVRKIAEAVHHAHEHGIIHRDLKPANVLLDAEGQPKVTDFGLAKRLEVDNGATLSGQIMGTPSYMPPEQACGQVDLVGPTSDVYGLGGILYRVLTGRAPFQAATIAETLLQVREQDPVPLRTLNPVIERDLETICLKCLQKNPQQRYPSAQVVAEELGRFLRHEPILARPAGKAERAWRWCRRNRVVAGLIMLAGLLATTLAIGGPVAAVRESWLRGVAEGNERAAQAAAADAKRQRDIARRTAEQFFVSVSKDDGTGRDRGLLANEPGTQALRRKLLGYAQEYFEKLLAEQMDDPSARADTANVYLHLARINQDIAPGAKAMEFFESARQILESLVAEDPENTAVREMLGRAWYGIAANRRAMGRFDAATEAYSRSIEVRRSLTVDHPEVGGYTNDLATSYNNLAIAYMKMTRYPDAQRYFDLARELEERLVQEDPANVNYARDLAGLFNNLGMLNLYMDHSQEASKYFERSLDMREKLYQANPSDVILARDVAASYLNMSNLRLATKDFEGSARTVQEAIRIAEKLATENPLVSEFQVSKGHSHLVHAMALKGLSKLDEAAVAGSTAREIFERLFAASQSVYEHATNLDSVYSFLIQLESRRNRPDEELLLLEKRFSNLEQLDQSAQDKSTNAKRLSHVASAIAFQYDKSGRMIEALNWLRRALTLLEAKSSLLEKTIRDHGSNKERLLELAADYTEIGRTKWRLGEFDGATAAYELAQPLLEKLIAGDPVDEICVQNLALLRLNWGLTLIDQSRVEEAIDSFTKAIAGQESISTKGHAQIKQNLRSSIWGRADAQRRLGKYAEAMQDFDRALTLDDGQDGATLTAERAAVLARMGHHAEAASAAMSLEKEGERNGLLLFSLARAMAAAAGAVDMDLLLTPDERAPLCERYAARSVLFLNDALASGHFTRTASVQKFKLESDFSFLRSRQDFQRLVDAIAGQDSSP